MRKRLERSLTAREANKLEAKNVWLETLISYLSIRNLTPSCYTFYALLSRIRLGKRFVLVWSGWDSWPKWPCRAKTSFICACQNYQYPLCRVFRWKRSHCRRSVTFGVHLGCAIRRTISFASINTTSPRRRRTLIVWIKKPLQITAKSTWRERDYVRKPRKNAPKLHDSQPDLALTISSRASRREVVYQANITLNKLSRKLDAPFYEKINDSFLVNSLPK